MLPCLTTSACVLRYYFTHSMFGCLLLPQEALQNIAAVRKGPLRSRLHEDVQLQPPSSHHFFNISRRFSQQLEPVFIVLKRHGCLVIRSQRTLFVKSLRIKGTGAGTLVKDLLVSSMVIWNPMFLAELTKTRLPATASWLFSTKLWRASCFLLTHHQQCLIMKRFYLQRIQPKSLYVQNEQTADEFYSLYHSPLCTSHIASSILKLGLTSLRRRRFRNCCNTALSKVHFQYYEWSPSNPCMLKEMYFFTFVFGPSVSASGLVSCSTQSLICFPALCLLTIYLPRVPFWK